MRRLVLRLRQILADQRLCFTGLTQLRLRQQEKAVFLRSLPKEGPKAAFIDCDPVYRRSSGA